MVDRIVYLGFYNNYKKEELFKKAINYLIEGRGDRFYYILPNGILLEDYRQRMIEEVGGAFDINLFTFDDIVDRLLEDRFYTLVDSNAKEIILYQIVNRLMEEGKLNYYRSISSKKGFISSLIYIIGQIKRSLISVEDYFESCPKEPFFTEIGLIYEEYERQLSFHNLIDREGSFFKALSLLREDNSFFNGLDYIIIDGFFDFRPQELELLKEISKTNCPIFINMPFNRKNNFNTLIETLGLLEKLGYRVEKEERGGLSYYEELANHIFIGGTKKLEPNSNTYLIKAANTHLELKKIAELIKRHKLEGISLKDMAIVLVDSADYKDRLFQVFKEEGIPTSLNKEIKLIELPLIRELLHILQLKENTKESIINRIKSSYFNLINIEDREAIEYHLRKIPFKSIEELIKDLSFNPTPYDSEIEALLLSLEEEFNMIPHKASIKDYTTILMNFLEGYQIEEKIFNIYEQIKDYQLFHRDMSALNKLRDILNRVSKLYHIIQDEISYKDYINLLSSYFEKESIVEVLGNFNGVNILTPVTARGKKYRIVFITGLSQGNYPNLMEENFFFREENYHTLKDMGLDVKNYYEKLDKEAILFSTAIASCKEKLCLSYSENATEDEKDIPSIFLDELLNSINGKDVKEKLNLIEVDMDYIIKEEADQLTTRRELYQYLLETYTLNSNKEEQIPIYGCIEEDILLEIDERIKCEAERDKREFNQYSGNIEDEYIAEDIRNIHKKKVYSISYLESYGRCPYYFLLNNLLNVEEMERQFQDFTPLDRGQVNHQVLKEYYNAYQEEIRAHIMGEKDFNPEETYDFIVSKIRDNMNLLNIDLDSKLWQLRIENNASRILEFIQSDLNRLSRMKKKIVPVGYEISFGRTKPFQIEIDGMKIPFAGVIDRIDKYVDEDKYIIIDYKNSSSNIRDIGHMKAGLSLQLPIYIMSQERQVVAAFYGIISTGEFQAKLGHVDEKNLISKTNRGALTEEELEELLNTTKQHIKFFIESILAGNFSVNPLECSSYCIYRQICRYKQTWEVE